MFKCEKDLQSKVTNKVCQPLRKQKHSSQLRTLPGKFFGPLTKSRTNIIISHRPHSGLRDGLKAPLIRVLCDWLKAMLI